MKPPADSGHPLLAHLLGERPAAPEWFSAALARSPERSQVVVDGAAIETLAWGRVGDPGLLLLHGNGAHADWYSFIAPLLADRCRVVAMSFSGMGGSDWRERYSVSQWADEALAAADHGRLFDAGQAPLAVAHSFGGFALMTAAARHGERLRGAVIVDTPLRPPDAQAVRERRRIEREFKPSRVYATQEEAVSRFRLLPPQHCEHLFIADHIARTSLKPVVTADGEPGWTWRFDPFLFKNFKFGEPHRDLGRARCPVVMVRGARSRLVTPELFAYGLSLAPPGSQQREIPDADHHVMLDQPLAFVALLAELMSMPLAPAAAGPTMPPGP
jgi:pimeloyl-ACP methyl ester carboxylesterase